MNAAPIETAKMNKLTRFLRNVAALTLLAAFGASAQTFTTEQRISTLLSPSLNPTVAAVGNNVYVVWVEAPASDGFNGDIWFRRSIDGGNSFLAPIQLTTTPARNDIVPLIAAGGNQVHIYWTDSGSVGELFYRRSTDGGATFFPEVQMTATDGYYSVPQGAIVDANGNVHLAFQDARPPAFNYGQVFYQCSGDQGASYTAAEHITRFDGQVDNESPRFAQGTDGTLYVNFRSTREGIPQGGFPPFEQYVMRTINPVTTCASVSWMRPPQRISDALPDEFANKYGGNIIAGANNVLHAAFWSDKLGTNLIYRRGFPNGAGWQAPIDISGHGANHLEWDGTVPGHTSFGLAEDAAGKLHAIFGENNHIRDTFQVGQMYYRCSNDGGATWASRQLVNAQPETAQARGAYANNKFHMVWMDWRDNASGSEIYYRAVNTGTCGGGVQGALTDVNADGRSDLLYRNFSTGQVYRMTMNGFIMTSQALAHSEPNLAWKIISDADFNGDGTSDYLWRNSSTGQVYLMPNGTNGLPSGGGFIYTEPNAAWKIVHTPDLDGDGKADLLWWNSSTGQVFGMLWNGTSFTTQGFIYTEPNTNWKIVAVGDFSGIGKDNQLLWRNSTTGQVFMMTVNVVGGGFTQTGQMIYQDANTNWKIIATADFNGDGRSDILWRNDATGQVYMMLMNGGTIQNANMIHTEPNLAWKIVSVGDYNGDGRADLLWRNDATGQVYMMLMNGLVVTNQALIYTEPNLNWRLLGPLEYAQ